jgi:hypothetical protein
MTIRNFSNQQGRLASLFFAVALAGSLAACGGGGGGGAPPAAPAPAAPAPPAPAPNTAQESQLVLTLATPSYANGTITTAGATVTRESRTGDTFSGNRPYCAITVDKATNGANKYQIQVYFLIAGGAVTNASIFDDRFNLPTTYGGNAINPPASAVSVEPLLKYINFSNAIVGDTALGTTATVNGKLYFGVANSTDVCGN